ncbi:MAG: calcium-binding protein [Paracoccaceae bacterium]
MPTFSTPESHVNTAHFDSGSGQAIVTLANGGWVVAWEGFGLDGSSYGIFQQAFNADGSPRGGEIQVNTYTTNSQDEPAMTALADGGWVVVWTSRDQDGSSDGVFLQVFNADGSARGGEVQVNTYVSSSQNEPAIATLADGGWVVTWTSYGQDGSNHGIYQQAFNVDGSPRGGEVQVNTTSADTQIASAVAGLTGGGWVVTWTSENQDGDLRGIYQQVYNANGTPRGGEVLVNTETEGEQELPEIAALADGGWVVVWRSDSQDGDSYGVFQQAYNANGTPQGDEVQVNSTAAGWQYLPTVAGLADGGWVVTWTSVGQDGDAGGIYQQIYNANGTERGGEMQVNHDTDGAQTYSAVAALASGGWVVAWQTPGQYGALDVVQSVYSVVAPATSGADLMFGSLPGERMNGLAGNDTILGGGGNDTLRGGSDDDLMTGGDGDDIVIGGTGRDTIFGNAGTDIIRGTGGFDTINGGDGDDSVFGGAQADRVLGGDGNDTCEGGGGFDTIDGGLGNDVLSGNFNADRFVFHDSHGDDTITDFEATNNAEKIDLSDVSAIASLADLNLGSASAGAATQVGADVVIDTGGGNSITLLNVSLADLDANDFIF